MKTSYTSDNVLAFLLVHLAQFCIEYKGRNFRGKFFFANLAKFAKSNSVFDPHKCRFAKIYSSEILRIGDSNDEPRILEFLSDTIFWN